MLANTNRKTLKSNCLRITDNNSFKGLVSISISMV